MDNAIMVMARMGSTRLPGKHMLPILGKPIIQYYMERLMSETNIPLILCTTELSEDDVLVDVAKDIGIDMIYRGYTDNILARQAAAAKEFNVDFIISGEADDVLVDTDMINHICDYNKHLYRGYLRYITYTDRLPVGAAPVGYTYTALKVALYLSRNSEEKEGQRRWFTQTGVFNVTYLGVNRRLHRSDIRLTLDYQEDYEFFKAFIEKVAREREINDFSKYYGINIIVSYLDAYPELLDINKGAQEKYEKRFKELYPDFE